MKKMKPAEFFNYAHSKSGFKKKFTMAKIDKPDSNFNNTFHDNMSFRTALKGMDVYNCKVIVEINNEKIEIG